MPSVEHVLYIPAVLLVGIAIGFRLGARAARAELERQQRERRR
ncbi:MAG: hypothetical protein NZ898_13400 [Myxococcota bacterium]|nr:hypothetical protein [Myxococcota bacterium]MDW8363278.1 hypothetical protein [Myxococcales bacterium]